MNADRAADDEFVRIMENGDFEIDWDALDSGSDDELLDAEAERDALDHDEIDAGSDRRKSAAKLEESDRAAASTPIPTLAKLPEGGPPQVEEDEFDGITLPTDWTAWNYDRRWDWENPTPGSMTVHEQRMRKLVAAAWRAAHPDEGVERDRATDLPHQAFDWMANSVTAESWDDETPPTPPTICHIEGTVGALFGVGRIHRLYGLSGSGKSWVCKMAAIEVLAAGGRVLWIDTDSIYPDFRSHLKAMGLARDVALSGRLHYFRAEGSLRGERFRTLLHSSSWDLVVVDGFNAAMSLSGLKGGDDFDVNTFFAEVLYVAAGTGSTVILVDHMRKDGESDHGSVFKRNLLTGTDYSVKRLSGFAPDVRGHSAIGLTQKDRQGWATALHSKRNRPEDQPFAYLIIDSTGNSGVPTVVTIELDEPLDLIVRTTLTQANSDADKLRDLLRDNPAGFNSGADVYKALTALKKGMTNTQISAAAKILVADGEATRTKVGLSNDLRPTSKLLKP